MHIYYQKVPENQFKLEQLDLIIKLNTLCFGCNGAQPGGTIRPLDFIGILASTSSDECLQLSSILCFSQEDRFSKNAQ